jgi:hypothetical protein
MLQFVKDKFDVLLITFVFLAIFATWVLSGFPGELRDFVVGSFGGFLAALGLRPRPNQQFQAETLTADSIGTAKTETGDIIAREIHTKETNQ